MGKVQLFKEIQESYSLAKRALPKGKINLSGLRYEPNPEAPIDTFVSTIPKKKLSEIEIFRFRQYLLGKKIDIKITPKEIEELFAHEGEEFKLQAFEFLTKKLNVPKQLTPQLMYMEVPNTKMAYDFVTNIMSINPKIKFADKSEIFSLLRHEYQHFMQNMAILRHPTKGKEATEFYAKLHGKATANNVDTIARQVSLEQLRSLGHDENVIREYQLLKDLIANNKTQEYEAYLAEVARITEANALPELEKFRANVIKEMKPLKEGSSEAKRAEKYFEATTNEQGYYQNGEIDYGKFMFDIRENEAMIAQNMVAMKTNESMKQKGCYIKVLKETEKALEDGSNLNKKVIEDIDNYTDKLTENGFNFKELLSYLFD